MGPAGSGQLTKMVNQICIAGIVQGLAEGDQLRACAPASTPSQVVDVDPPRRRAELADGEPWPRRWRAGEFDFGFAVEWMRKDLGIVPRRGEPQRRPAAGHRARRPVLRAGRRRAAASAGTPAASSTSSPTTDRRGHGPSPVGASRSSGGRGPPLRVREELTMRANWRIRRGLMVAGDGDGGGRARPPPTARRRRRRAPPAPGRARSTSRRTRRSSSAAPSGSSSRVTCRSGAAGAGAGAGLRPGRVHLHRVVQLRDGDRLRRASRTASSWQGRRRRSSPGPVQVTARLTVIDTATGDPLPQAVDVAAGVDQARGARWRSASPGRAARGRRCAACRVSYTCDQPWIEPDMRRRAAPGRRHRRRAHRSSTTALRCDDRWHSEWRADHAGLELPFHPGAGGSDRVTSASADPGSFDPVAAGALSEERSGIAR